MERTNFLRFGNEDEASQLGASDYRGVYTMSDAIYELIARAQDSSGQAVNVQFVINPIINNQDFREASFVGRDFSFQGSRVGGGPEYATQVPSLQQQIEAAGDALQRQQGIKDAKREWRFLEPLYDIVTYALSKNFIWLLLHCLPRLNSTGKVHFQNLDCIVFENAFRNWWHREQRKAGSGVMDLTQMSSIGAYMEKLLKAWEAHGHHTEREAYMKAFFDEGIGRMVPYHYWPPTIVQYAKASGRILTPMPTQGSWSYGSNHQQSVRPKPARNAFGMTDQDVRRVKREYTKAAGTKLTAEQTVDIVNNFVRNNQFLTADRNEAAHSCSARHVLDIIEFHHKVKRLNDPTIAPKLQDHSNFWTAVNDHFRYLFAGGYGNATDKDELLEIYKIHNPVFVPYAEYNSDGEEEKDEDSSLKRTRRRYSDMDAGPSTSKATRMSLSTQQNESQSSNGTDDTEKTLPASEYND